MKSLSATIGAVAALLLLQSVYAFAQPPSEAYISPTDEGPSSAVDAKGVRHRGEEYPNRLSPWYRDIIKSVAPDYSYNDRLRRNQGKGVFRLMLDLNNGAVTGVSIVRSTGCLTLDNSAVDALWHWRWKPGKWREIEMPVRFTLTQTFSPAAGSIKIPRS